MVAGFSITVKASFVFVSAYSRLFNRVNISQNPRKNKSFKKIWPCAGVILMHVGYPLTKTRIASRKKKNQCFNIKTRISASNIPNKPNKTHAKMDESAALKQKLIEGVKREVQQSTAKELIGVRAILLPSPHHNPPSKHIFLLWEVFGKH